MTYGLIIDKLKKITFSCTLGFIIDVFDLDVDGLCKLRLVSLVPCSAKLNIALKLGYLFPMPCLTWQKMQFLKKCLLNEEEFF